MSLALADVIAHAMKEWALSKGATHYSHWFLPMTSGAAEKHDTFLNFSRDGSLILQFSGKELIRGEPDASSFPSGGLRSTFEARGYTVWDMGSPPFVKRNTNGVTLMIPTAFCSWTGEALDKKTPLLRSSEALSNNAIALLRVLGDNESKTVNTTVGAEQEFFLIDRGFYLARHDLMFAGRTLLGARPPKGQELEDHYFGKIPSRVLAYLQEVEDTLWRLGVPVKTRHNEVAPAQFEVAPHFESSSLALDHNVLLMDVLKEVAVTHGFACLLHEKPFSYINGSGKHNNWSMSTNQGSNLLDPGNNPKQNMRFLVFLAAVMRAIDLHADLVRASIAAPGNDHRLGANEAPPAIISIFLGQELDAVVRDIMAGADSGAQEFPHIKLGTSVLPPLPRDSTDRNRTSPFAFTGNKFEFRAVGSSQTMDWSTMTLNTVVADSCKWLAAEITSKLAESDGKQSKEEVIQSVVQGVYKKHYRVVNNGNGYSSEWPIEAEARGLPNFRNGPQALAAYDKEENVQLFAEYGVLLPVESRARSVIYHENFLKALNIEVQTLKDIVSTEVIPAATKFQQQLAASYREAAAALGDDAKELLAPQLAQVRHVASQVKALYELLEKTPEVSHDESHSVQEHLSHFHSQHGSWTSAVRAICDDLESKMDNGLWPLPKYSEMLFYMQ
eukprot:TRINITY_DN939_c0_g1_i14.p1 TRINITY_DN939_c0_g1~~TRINITY_DN939_c0_g1_i14.p1  ORF type:complete len:756 (+),score=368.98 TRINITY_DN939_c0_g1_i14:257-2269(+)